MKYNTKEIEKHFNERQIKSFMEELGLSYFSALAYLYFYNFVSISPKDLKTDNGQPMYKEFAKGLDKMLNKFIEAEVNQ